MKKSKIGKKGYRLVEKTLDGTTCVTLMYKDWYVLRFNKGMIELAIAIYDEMRNEDERALKVDEMGRVLISKETF